MSRAPSWQEDIGLAAEAVLRAENGPCVVFDDIPGCAKGFRVLLNVFAGTRRNMTLGFPDHLNKWELSQAYRDAYLKEPRIMPHEIVADGPVLENVMMGDEVDVDEISGARCGTRRMAGAISAPAPTASRAIPRRTGSMPAPIARRCTTRRASASSWRRAITAISTARNTLPAARRCRS